MVKRRRRIWFEMGFGLKVTPVTVEGHVLLFGGAGLALGLFWLGQWLAEKPGWEAASRISMVLIAIDIVALMVVAAFHTGNPTNRDRSYATDRARAILKNTL